VEGKKMGAILRLKSTLGRYLGAPRKNRKQQKDAPLRVHRLTVSFFLNKISEVLPKKKRQQHYALNNMFFCFKSKAKKGVNKLIFFVTHYPRLSTRHTSWHQITFKLSSPNTISPLFQPLSLMNE
jgi:hypothetical protein